VTADILSALRSGSAGPVDLPRSQVGSPPQHLLITLLADYWSGQTEPLPSGALVRLAGEFGVTAVGARAALSRLARRGLLAYSKVGRNTYYGLTERTAEALEASRHRVLSFGERPPPWDGYWTVAAFSLPEERRTCGIRCGPSSAGWVSRRCSTACGCRRGPRPRRPGRY